MVDTAFDLLSVQSVSWEWQWSSRPSTYPTIIYHGEQNYPRFVKVCNFYNLFFSVSVAFGGYQELASMVAISKLHCHVE